MSQNHSVTKPHRRQKDTKRKEFMRETMIKLRSAPKVSLATRREKELVHARGPAA